MRRQTPTVSCSLLILPPWNRRKASDRSGAASTTPVRKLERALGSELAIENHCNRAWVKSAMPYDSTTQRKAANKRQEQKGQPRRAALFDASHNSAERRLRGLLESAEQR